MASVTSGSATEPEAATGCTAGRDDLLGDRLGDRLVEVLHDDHARPPPARPQRDGPPDAAPGSGDQRAALGRSRPRLRTTAEGRWPSAMEFLAISLVIGPMRNSRLSRQYRWASVSAA